MFRGNRLPDGFFVNDLVFWGISLSRQSVLTRGASVHLPNLKSADTSSLNEFWAQSGAMLGGVEDRHSLQWSWTVDSDYDDVLSAYENVTKERAIPGSWCSERREALSQRYRLLMDRGFLRRERLELYYGKKADTLDVAVRTADQKSAYLAEEARGLGNHLKDIERGLPGSVVTPYGDYEHFESHRRFWSPSESLVKSRLVEEFDPERSILENGLGSDIISTKGKGGMYLAMDGMWHSVLVINKWPSRSRMGLIWKLTSALNYGYRITVNCYPLNAQEQGEKMDLERRRARLSADSENSMGQSVLADSAEAQARILTEGYVRPYQALMVVRVWAPSEEELIGRMAAVKSAIGGMGGSRSVMVNEKTQAIKMLSETIPGRLGSAYRGWDLMARAGEEPTSCFLQNLIPFSTSYVGDVSNPDALMDGDFGEIVGVPSFSGKDPLHMSVTGASRSGKSGTMIGYMGQTDCLFDFTAIIDYGRSYATFVKLCGGELVYIKADGSICINYFDTYGEPLENGHKAFVAALLLKLSGCLADADTLKLRRLILADHIEQEYKLMYDQWIRNSSGRSVLAGRLAAATMAFGEKHHVGGSTMDKWAAFKELERTDLSEYNAIIGSIEEEDAIRFERSSSTNKIARQLAFSLFEPKDFSTHSAFIEQLEYDPIAGHSEKDINHLITTLKPWREGGQYGGLLDGYSNIRFGMDCRVVCFELGDLDDSLEELREVGFFLASHVCRQMVFARPRASWKQIFFEELSKLCKTQGVGDVVDEYYAQLGKMGCKVISATQQLGQLKKSGMDKVIVDNSMQHFVFKQKSVDEISRLQEGMGFTMAVGASIRNFRRPEQRRLEEGKYAELAIVTDMPEGTVSGLARYAPDEESLYVAESTGDTFDRREKDLGKYRNPVLGVKMEVQRLVRETEKRELYV